MAKVKLTVLIVAVALLLGGFGLMPLSNFALADAEAGKWSRVNLAAEGKAGNWVLASGSDVRYLTRAIDGSLYAYANPSGTSDRLFKSTDGGSSWSATGKVTEAVVALATAPDDARLVYYATTSNIYQSTDAGISFTRWALSPGGAGGNNVEITSLDVTPLGGGRLIVVATRDTDNAQYSGVYVLDEKEPWAGWVNTKVGNYDVYAVAFSPNFTTNQQLVAVVTDEANTLVLTRSSGNEWGRIIGTARMPGLVPRAAAIAFPEDDATTTENFTFFVAIDSGSNQGDVYRVNGMVAPASSVATDLNIGATYNLDNVDVTGLAVSGNTTGATLLAGAAGSAQIYISADSGVNWKRSAKAPSGQSKTEVLLAPDFITSGVAYTVTSGVESAFSYTADGGISWNQVSLIDTKISVNGLIDVAISPRYRQDNTLFLLTFNGENGEHSLWRDLSGGVKWERVLTKTLASAGSLNLVSFPSRYDSGRQVLFLAGASGGKSVIWKSVDKGQTFQRRSAFFPIDTWVVVSENTLFLASYNGTSGLVYRTTDGGLAYSLGAAVGSQPLRSIVLSPNYEQDETLLVGNTNGWVYWSKDNGNSFEPLPPDTTSPPLTGSITVAFDAKFGSNRTIYAASNSANKGIYRFIIDKSSQWESIDGTLPSGAKIEQLVVSADGTLYAANVKADGGLERSLHPAFPLTPTFETVASGLDSGATLSGLWLRGDQLWSFDTQNTRLVRYIDSLTLPIILTAPPPKAPGISTRNVSLEWQSLPGATKYQWQLDYETDFSSVPAGFEGVTEGSSVQLPALEMGTTYYWRMRAMKPVLSPWSAKWSFTTSLGAAVIAPPLYSPEAGASGVALKPVFQWGAIAGADSYELLVARDISFANAVIVKVGDYALPATAWQSNISLDDNTTYYWKVRARSTNSYSAWSAVGAFTTASPSPQTSTVAEPSLLPSAAAPSLLPTTPPPPSPSLSPLPQAQIVFPKGVTYFVIVLLLAIALLLIVIVVLLVRVRRS